MTSFFEQYGRKLFEMIGDGNCFYRGISYQLFGTQEEHSTIHSVVSCMENFNKEIFSPNLILGWNKPTIAEQIFHVSTPGTWATHVEVLATASVFEVPVYYCTQDSQGEYKWSVVKPITSLMKCNLKFLELSDVDDSITLLKPDHFELMYYDNLHYGYVSCLILIMFADHPILTGTESTVIDLTS